MFLVSCRGRCGGVAPSGCRCGHKCRERGDCCTDFYAQCQSSCVGHCGGVAPSGACHCERTCGVKGNCCPFLQFHCPKIFKQSGNSLYSNFWGRWFVFVEPMILLFWTYSNVCPGVLVWVNFGCFSLSRFSHFHCNAMKKAIKVHKNLHTNQHNKHIPGFQSRDGSPCCVWETPQIKPWSDTSWHLGHLFNILNI